MKKANLFILTFVPLIAGCSVQMAGTAKNFGTAVLLIVPLLTTVFWLWLGTRYARSSWGLTASVLMGNAVGILSLLVYLWQFLLETDQTRNMVLASVSQMFTLSTPTFLLYKIIILLRAGQFDAVQASNTTLEVISVIYMTAVFLCGYLAENHRLSIAAEKRERL